MPRKKIVKEPIEKLKDEMILEIIEDSSDEEDGDTPLAPNSALPPPPEDNAIRVSKGNQVISQMTVPEIKQEIAKPEKKKRVMTEEQKAKMKAGRERKKAEKALQAGKERKRPAPIITTNLEQPPVEEPPAVVNTDEPPRWFKAYLATQKKAEPVPAPLVAEVKTEPPVEPKKRGRGRPAGKKDSKPRAKPVKKAPVEPVEPAPVAQPKPAPAKPSMRFI
tara:strand:- start:299 stop:958 length:660 start_codon:yes stop_codon:yes gene_type:complete